MTTATVSPETESAAATDVSESIEMLRHTTTAVRLSFMWLGVRKTLTPGQKLSLIHI